MSNTENYFAWNSEHRRHFSVGAVIVNENGEILTVFLERVDGKYFLPTKTHAPNHSLEDTLAMVGAKVGFRLKLDSMLGMTEGEFLVPEGPPVRKFVLWFRCATDGAMARDPEDRDADAQIQWRSRSELEEIFAAQSHIASDVDQRNVLALLEN